MADPTETRSGSKLVRTFEPMTLSAAVAADISMALETNHIVYFPRSPVPLPDEATLRYLRTELPSQLRLKNISYHPQRQRLVGLQASANPVLYGRTATVLREHLESVEAFLSKAIPHLCMGWTVGKSSFRPIEERGRNLPPHASNELLHIDAGAYGATDGGRILRFFVNINEREDRVWASKGTLERVLDRHGSAAGLFDACGNLNVRIDKRATDHLRSFAVRCLGRLTGLAYTLDSSPYDRAMRRLHNYMKDSEPFKADMDGYQEIRFPPGSAWMVFTDGVSHASVSGQFALVTTIIVHRCALQYPRSSPYGLLSSHATGRSLSASG